MKIGQLKKIIKESVKEAIQEELGNYKPTPQENTQPSTPVQESKPMSTIESMLESTRGSMTSDDYKNVLNADSSMAQGFPTQTGGTTPSMGNQPGIDLNSLDFVKNASKIYNASIEKDKNRVGNGV